MNVLRLLGYAILMPFLAACAAPSPGPTAPGAPGPRTGSAGSQPMASASEWDRVVEAAKKEGTVVFYATAGFEPVLEVAIPAFKEKYGIAVDFVAGTGRDGQERIMAEQAGGRHVADVFQAGDTNVLALHRDGLLQPARGLPNAQKIAPDLQTLLLDPEGFYYPAYLNTYGMLVNTSQIPADRIPKSWRDLLDPWFKGKIILHNPATSGGGNSWFTVSWDVLERSYHEALAKQELIIVASPREVEAGVARGQGAVGVPGLPRAEVLQQGAPIKWIAPEEGIHFTPIFTALVKDAPHPNAGKVWMDFFLSAEVQKLVVDRGHNTSVRDDVEAPPSFSIRGKKFMGKGTRRLAGEEQAEMMRNARQIYGR